MSHHRPTAVPTRDRGAATVAPPEATSPHPPTLDWRRWAPFGAALLVCCALLVAADTSVLDIGRYLAYAAFAVVGPGTLVYRCLRARPHTLVEDLAFGAAVGLVLELVGWALFSAADLRGVMFLWPLLIYVPFLAIPGLRRRCLVPGGYPTRPTLAWSWTIAGAVSFFAAYLYGVFFAENPILPDNEGTKQFLDLPYQLSLAAEAKQHFPLQLPQVAGEPLQYHWFAFVHLAMGSMVGGIDLPVLTTRLMVLGISSLTILLIAVVGWRIAGRPLAGAVAALLYGVIGDFDFAAVPWPPFGTQVTFVVWPSLSMTYSWVLLVALIGAVADRLSTVDDQPRVAGAPPPIGRGAWVLAGLFALASSAAKASSLPVVLGGLGLAFVAVLLLRRRFSITVLGLGALAAGAFVFALAVVFRFASYGTQLFPLGAVSGYWGGVDSRGRLYHLFLVAAVWTAFLLHLQLRGAGVIPLLWLRRGRLLAAEWFLLGGAIAGPGLNLMLNGYAATWFTRSGFPFGILLSACGFVLVYDRARLSARGRLVLGASTAAFALVLTVVSWRWALTRYPTAHSYSPLKPMLAYGAVLAGVAVVVGIGWLLLRRRMSWLRGRGGVALLAAVLVAGAPGLVLDVRMSWGVPGGPYEEKVLISASWVQAARWVRAHSEPGEIVATNMHCSSADPPDCDRTTRSFWLSAYSERSVLIEGWAFAPRMQGRADPSFWDPALFALNEEAFYDPSAETLRRLAEEHHVHYLVAVRGVRPESPDLRSLAGLVYEAPQVAVYDLTMAGQGP